jgi:hypothetical protein
MITVSCKECGRKFKTYISNIKIGKSKFCSRECYGKWRSKNIKGEKNPRWGKIKKVCEVCHRTFYISPSNVEKGYGRFCSRECMGKAYYKKEKKECLYCKKEFYIRPSRIRANRGRFCSKECANKWLSENRRGEKSSGWKGGITPINKLIRATSKYEDWRMQVFKKDNFTCQRCGAKRGLNAHHKKPLSQILSELKEKYPLFDLYEVAMNDKELWDINNGITLCEKCHEEIHKEIENKKEPLLIEVR